MHSQSRLVRSTLCCKHEILPCLCTAFTQYSSKLNNFYRPWNKIIMCTSDDLKLCTSLPVLKTLVGNSVEKYELLNHAANGCLMMVIVIINWEISQPWSWDLRTRLHVYGNSSNAVIGASWASVDSNSEMFLAHTGWLLSHRCNDHPRQSLNKKHFKPTKEIVCKGDAYLELKTSDFRPYKWKCNKGVCFYSFTKVIFFMSDTSTQPRKFT